MISDQNSSCGSPPLSIVVNGDEQHSSSTPVPTSTSVSRSKPQACRICGRVLASTSSYYVHLKSHSNNKPYRCTQCEACFCRKPYLEVSAFDHLFSKKELVNILLVLLFLLPFLPTKWGRPLLSYTFVGLYPLPLLYLHQLKYHSVYLFLSWYAFPSLLLVSTLSCIATLTASVLPLLITWPSQHNLFFPILSKLVPFLHYSSTHLPKHAHLCYSHPLPNISIHRR